MRVDSAIKERYISATTASDAGQAINARHPAGPVQPSAGEPLTSSAAVPASHAAAYKASRLGWLSCA
jgi:hypothetical protein